MSRRAATTITSICAGPSALAGGSADDAVLDHRFLERHRDLLLGAEADGGVELVGVLDRGQAQGAGDEALVGDPEADLAAEAVLVEEGAEGGGDGLGLGDLAVAEGLRRQRLDARLDHLRHAVLELGFDRGDAARLDLQPDHDAAGALLAAEARQRELGPAEGPATAAGTARFGPPQFGPAGARQADLLGQEGAHRKGNAAGIRRLYPSAASALNKSVLPRSGGTPRGARTGAYREIGDTRPRLSTYSTSSLPMTQAVFSGEVNSGGSLVLNLSSYS